MCLLALASVDEISNIEIFTMTDPTNDLFVHTQGSAARLCENRPSEPVDLCTESNHNEPDTEFQEIEWTIFFCSFHEKIDAR